ncbi:MAG: hypothetical protein ACE5IR_18840 [bacterium]
MAKRKKLENLVRGRGVEALSGSSDLTEDETAQNSNDLESGISSRRRRENRIRVISDLEEASAEEKLLPENEPKPAPKENLIMPKIKVTEIEPEEEELSVIQELTNGLANYLVAWDAYTSKREKFQSHFELGSPITFEINCAASEIFAELKTKFKVEIITYDMRTLQPQKIYGLSRSQHIESGYFQISYSTEAVQKGLFGFKVILSMQGTHLFQVCEGDYFQVV